MSKIKSEQKIPLLTNRVCLESFRKKI